ncbi:MAG: hypothetical protein IJV37_05860 [Bacteroidales bacterium]|nr:hypothetical protein [Bacteroidales bacterium]
MKTVLNHLVDYINQCAGCRMGRHGECPWMQQYLSAVETREEVNNETCEQRILRLFDFVEAEACDEQRSFDWFISEMEIRLNNADVPNSYRGLCVLLSVLRQHWMRRARFSKAIKPLLGDMVGAGCCRCLAKIDYVYLSNGYDIIDLLVDSFPEYSRLKIFENLTYSPFFIEQAIKHAQRLSKEEMEILGILIPPCNEELGLGISMSDIADQQIQDVRRLQILPEEHLRFLTPYLEVLVEKHYCDKDYRWINSDHEGGHAYTEAAWVVYMLFQNNTKLVQYKVGEFLGIKRITNYRNRVPDDAPYKNTFRRLFREANLPFD